MNPSGSLADLRSRITGSVFKYSNASFRTKNPDRQLTKWERFNIVRGMALTFSDLITDALVLQEFYQADEIFWFVLSMLIIANRTIITAVVGSGVAAQSGTNRSWKHILYVMFYFIIAFLQLNHVYDGARSLWKGVMTTEFQFTKATTAMMQSIPQSLLQAYFVLSKQEASPLQIISLAMSIASVALSTIESERLMAPRYIEGYRKWCSFMFRTCEIAICLSVYGLFAFYARGYFFLVFIGKFSVLAVWALYDYKRFGRSIIAIRCGHEVAGMGVVLMAVDFAITAYVPIALLRNRPLHVEDHFFLVGASVPSFVLSTLLADVLYGVMSVVILIAYNGYDDEFTRNVFLLLAVIYGFQHVLLSGMVITHPAESRDFFIEKAITGGQPETSVAKPEPERAHSVHSQKSRSYSGSSIITEENDEHQKNSDDLENGVTPRFRADSSLLDEKDGANQDGEKQMEALE